MIEGESGIMACSPRGFRPLYEPSKRRLTWPNGAVATAFSAEDPESLRGPQFDLAWCDEFAKWRYAQDAWDQLQFGLRLGDDPRQIITTTPRNTAALKAIINDPTTVVSGASTYANKAFLASTFLRKVVAKYEGTRLGRQELMAELLEDNPDALWQRAALDAKRIRVQPDLRRIVVAVDPPVTSGEDADECGIIVAGKKADGDAVVLADRSIQGLSPAKWAARAVAAYHEFEADCIVAEVNNGGDLIPELIKQIDSRVPVRSVRASRGKVTRAEPIAALYEQGRVSHLGALPQIEDQMCEFTQDFDRKSMGYSPDRVDALVWALTELMISANDGLIDFYADEARAAREAREKMGAMNG